MSKIRNEKHCWEGSLKKPYNKDRPITGYRNKKTKYYIHKIPAEKTTTRVLIYTNIPAPTQKITP
ncbi:MAG: hypothetical protein ABIB93_08055, partial [Chloroflexota bacterium]